MEALRTLAAVQLCRGVKMLMIASIIWTDIHMHTHIYMVLQSGPVGTDQDDFMQIILIYFQI